MNSLKNNIFAGAKWIAPQGIKNEKNVYFRAVKKFRLTEKVPLKLHISAESYYILYINGFEVGRGPIRNTRTRNYYDSYDLLPFLKAGENTLAVLVYCSNKPNFISAPAQPGLILTIDKLLKSDKSFLVQRAGEWRQNVQEYTFQTGACEWRDFRKTPSEQWKEGTYTDNWELAEEIPVNSGIYNKNLIPRDVPLLRESIYFPVVIPLVAEVPPLADQSDIKIAEIMTKEKHFPVKNLGSLELNSLLNADGKSVTIPKPKDGHGILIIFDFDKEIVGSFRMELSSSHNMIVDICCEEEIINGRLKADHIAEEYNFADRYILDDKRRIVGNTICERGFRKVQVVFRNISTSIIIHKVEAIDRRYPFVNRGNFISSDFMLNKIWDVSRETLSACTTDVFTDCPWRERAFYINDLVVENKVSLQLFGNSSVFRRALDLAFSQPRPSGLIPSVCPCPETDADRMVLLPSNLYIGIILKDYLLYSGDKAFVMTIFPGFEKILEVFYNWMDESGIIIPPEEHWNFFDWSYELNEISFNGKKSSLLNYLYIIAMKHAMDIAGFCDIDIDIEEYKRRIIKASAELETRFFNEETKRLIDCPDSSISSQLAHTFALLSGEYSREKGEFFEEALLDNNILMAEMYLHFFVFHAMQVCGKENEALKRIRKYWGDIIKTGSPTIWEVGIMDTKGKNAFGQCASLCHGFATAPVDFMQTVILGIYPIEPGFKTFMVNPKNFDLNFAKGRIPTPEGAIHIRWECLANILRIKLKVPPNLTALTKIGKFGSGEHEFELNINNKKEI